MTGSFSISPWKVLLCFLSRFRAKGLSFSASAKSCKDAGRGRFSPDTRRVGGVGNAKTLFREGVEGVGICDLKGDFDTRLLLRTCLKLEEVRRGTSAPRVRPGESLLDILRGDVMDPPLVEEPIELIEPVGGEFHPSPDSRKMEFFMGSGEFDSSRSRRGDLWLAMFKRPVAG